MRANEREDVKLEGQVPSKPNLLFIRRGEDLICRYVGNSVYVVDTVKYQFTYTQNTGICTLLVKDVTIEDAGIYTVDTGSEILGTKALFVWRMYIFN